jgi:hypothetical protein
LYGKSEIVELLVNNGADVNARNNNGYNAVSMGNLKNINIR